ncbi:hypothetical protein CC86DRAFT_384631 [Ophiobolus disseminans]|uniref:Uncharacterized protein n=1 Tax=Ophiobolus disseminans TaxID=1469910 RepID=A0A6A6ZR43_9PLEO|nr:hypothetical protein CC86DRAFT_384631 [Ophiobolus disseminans]
MDEPDASKPFLPPDSRPISQEQLSEEYCPTSRVQCHHSAHNITATCWQALMAFYRTFFHVIHHSRGDTKERVVTSLHTTASSLLVWVGSVSRLFMALVSLRYLPTALARQDVGAQHPANTTATSFEDNNAFDYLMYGIMALYLVAMWFIGARAKLYSLGIMLFMAFLWIGTIGDAFAAGIRKTIFKIWAVTAFHSVAQDCIGAPDVRLHVIKFLAIAAAINWALPWTEKISNRPDLEDGITVPPSDIDSDSDGAFPLSTQHATSNNLTESLVTHDDAPRSHYVSQERLPNPDFFSIDDHSDPGSPRSDGLHRGHRDALYRALYRCSTVPYVRDFINAVFEIVRSILSFFETFAPECGYKASKLFAPTSEREDPAEASDTVYCVCEENLYSCKCGKLTYQQYIEHLECELRVAISKRGTLDLVSDDVLLYEKRRIHLAWLDYCYVKRSTESYANSVKTMLSYDQQVQALQREYALRSQRKQQSLYDYLVTTKELDTRTSLPKSASSSLSRPALCFSRGDSHVSTLDNRSVRLDTTWLIQLPAALRTVYCISQGTREQMREQIKEQMGEQTGTRMGKKMGKQMGEQTRVVFKTF